MADFKTIPSVNGVNVSLENHTHDDIDTSNSLNTPNTIVKRDESGNFSANVISADLSGNASTATKLATARSISLTGDITGSTNFDGSGNVTIAATVADDSHNHVISNIDGLQSALDSKSPSNHNHNSAYLGINANAVSASKLATARSIALAGDVTGSTSFDGSGNVTIAATVADDSHNHVISNIDGLQSVLDSKSPSNHNHNSAYLGINANAVSASKLATARALTIGNTAKNFDGGANISWTLAEIGAAASNHGHSNYLNKLGTDTLLNGEMRITHSGSYSYLQFGNSDSDTNANLRISRNSTTTEVIKTFEVYTESMSVSGDLTATAFKTGNFEIVHNATTDSLDFNYVG